MQNSVFEKARGFMYRNARPLDMARFQYHFEDGSKDQVIRVLSYYQNQDGGFGHGIEADCWNPNSIPLHANGAGDIIKEIDFTDAGHPVIRNLLKWYESGAHFDGKAWALTVESNHHYPHAPWWHTESESSCHTDYNGTAQIAGFIVRYAEPGSDIFRLGVRIVNEAIEALALDGLSDMHTCACYVRMMEDIEKANMAHLFPYDSLREKLHHSVNSLIEKDQTKWGGYICKPSQFMRSRDSEYYHDNREIAEYECRYIMDSQLEDGSWEIPWGWENYPEEWAISKNWWKGTVIILNLLYLKGFDALL